MKKGHIQLRMLLSVTSLLFILSGCGLEGDPSLHQLVGGGSVNTPPTADAGKDQRIEVGKTITITGIGTDSDGSIISYEWRKGTEVLATVASFSYTPTVVGTEILVLTVTDDEGATASDEMNVTVNAIPNQSPIADAGKSQTVTEGNSVTLDGSGSSDPDGSIVSYQWMEGSTVLGTTVSFSKADFSVGVHTLVLTVTDDDGATGSEDVNITVTGLNTAPVAVITKPLANTTYYCYEGSNPSIVLDGSESSDKDGDALTYAWSGTVGTNTVSINSLINGRTNKVTSISRDDLCNFVDNDDSGVSCSSTEYGSRLAKTWHTEGFNNDAIYDPGTDSGCTVTIDLNVSDGSASGSDRAKVNIRIHFPT